MDENKKHILNKKLAELCGNDVKEEKVADHLKKIMTLLSEGADPNGKFALSNGNEFTPFQIAVERGNYETMVFLLEKGAKLTTLPNGETPLGLALNKSSSLKMELLLKAGADPNEKGESGRTLLHKAANGKLAKLTLLLTAGADPNARDNNGDTPIIVAVRLGAVNEAEMLLSFGADPLLRGKDMMNCLDILEKSSQGVSLENMIKCLKIGTLLSDFEKSNMGLTKRKRMMS